MYIPHSFLAAKEYRPRRVRVLVDLNCRTDKACVDAGRAESGMHVLKVTSPVASARGCRCAYRRNRRVFRFKKLLDLNSVSYAKWIF